MDSDLETVAKPVTRSFASSFFEILLEKSFENVFGKSFWAIQRFHHLKTPVLAQR